MFRMSKQIVRYNGKWHVIEPKEYEPERKTLEIAWKQIRDKMEPEEAYRSWYADQREKSKVLYLNKKNDNR